MTNNISKLVPIQFYKGRWFTHIAPLFKTSPKVQLELRRLCELRVSRMEDVIQEDFEPDDLKEQIELEDHIARVRCREFHWLVDVFTNAELCPLSFAIASELFPEKEWQILEGDDDEAIVTDRERAIVFDFVHCQSLSGLASLALCKDAEALNNLDAVKEVSRHYEERNARVVESVQRLKKKLSIGFQNMVRFSTFQRRAKSPTSTSKNTPKGCTHGCTKVARETEEDRN